MSRFILASFATLLPAEAVAHAFGERYDLPLPLHLWIAAAGLTVALSFVVIAASLRRRASHPRSFFLVRLHPVVVTAFRAVSVCVLFLLIAAGLFGTQDPFRNFAPAFVWIAWWIGFTYLSALLGNFWALLNPWTILHPKGLFRLPPPVGVWPAAALLLVFAWIEIVWEGNAVPANIAWLALGYSLLTWAGMFVFGGEAWLKSGEVFTVYFGFLARLAPIEVKPNGLHLRAPAAGLLDPGPLSSSEAFFVIVMLAIVTFDGLRETPVWAVSDAQWTVAATAGLFAMPWVFALVIFGVCALMGWLTVTSASELARVFIPTLLPIALAYHFAHYLSYLLVAGQVVIPLASDPLGRGWDLFGTARYQIAVGVVGARFAWYTSVIVIVAGHVLAMYLAHRLALARFSTPRLARRSQYPLAALMVGYTMLSLWILAQPIVVK
jgi:hypothetical protein